jgi:hypothetical protein
MRLASTLSRRALPVSLLLVVAGACGARTELADPEPEQDSEPRLLCLFDEDCPSADLCRPSACIEGTCRAGTPVQCDDGDECTEDSCDSETGACRFRELSSDQDGDGFKGPRAGYAPGAPGACGDDCDDTSPLAFPGGIEQCDGVDNDCNGIIDDGAEYNLISEEPLRLSKPDDKRSGASGLAFDGQRWAVTLYGDQMRREYRFLGISLDGDIELEQQLTNNNSGTWGGPLVWTGSVYGTAWSDNRQGGTIEAYFNRMDRNGVKFGDDLRLTQSSAFSLVTSLNYNGSEFLVFWDDTVSGVRSQFVQRIDLEGKLIGGPLRVSPEGVHAEFASLAFGHERVGIAMESTSGVGVQQRTLNFTSTSRDFAENPALITLDTEPDTHKVAFVDDRFMVVWSQIFLETNMAGEFVYGATLDEYGNLIRTKTALTPGGGQARSTSLLSLGDRALLFWSDNVEGNYELYVKTLDPEFRELTPPQRLTFAEGDSRNPGPAFGPQGQVGVVFEDRRSGSPQAYMLRLECVTSAQP